MTRFSAVIFDMDGLLLDSERIALAAFDAACEHFAIGEQRQVFMRCVGTNEAAGDEVLKEGLTGKADHVAFARVWDEKYTAATSGAAIPLKEGALELLEHLRALGVPAAVATSTTRERAQQKLRDAGILDRFQVVVGGDQVAKSKPHPDIYLHAAGLLRVDPRECLALEDSENGVRAALNAGMTVIQVPDLVPPSPELTALGHIILDTLRAVHDHDFAAVNSESLLSPGPRP